MAKKSAGNSGAIVTGNIRGSVNVKASGDIVGSNKITTTSTTTTSTIQRGFRNKEHKEQFKVELEQMKEALRTLRADLDVSAALTADQKDEAVGAITQQVTALREASDRAAQILPGKEASAGIGAAVEKTLNRAAAITETLETLTGKAGEVAGKIRDFGSKYGPLVLSVRQLFGLS